MANTYRYFIISCLRCIQIMGCHNSNKVCNKGSLLSGEQLTKKCDVKEIVKMNRFEKWLDEFIETPLGELVRVLTWTGVAIGIIFREW